MVKTHKNKGFSLVEIVVVIAVLAVLLAILVPTLFTYTENSRMQKDFSTMDELSNAMQLSLTDANIFDEVYEYAISNNYMTYTDSSGNYSQQLIDAEYWAPDGCANGVTITFNPENGYYNLSKGIVNDMTYGNGSVGEARTAEGDLKQCYFEEMGNQLFYSSVKQSIGTTLQNTSATYKASSYTVFIRFYIVDGTRKVDISGAFNGTNLSPDCPAAIVENTIDYTPENKPTTTRPASQGSAQFTQSDLSGGGSMGGIITRPSYKPCEHPSFEQFDETYHQCSVSDCKKQFEHEYPETGLTAKCTVCEYIKDHTCTFDKNNICTQCGEEKIEDFIIDQNNCYMAGITSLEGDIIIPKTFVYEGTKYRVKIIRHGAFYNCSKITSVTIPDSVTEIRNNAFTSCSGLKSIVIPNSVTSLGYAFCQCTSLLSITIPDGVTKIEANTFNGCASLKSATLSENTISIGGNAFLGCTSLENMKIPSSVTSIENNAFNGCSSLKSINIPNGITSIEFNTFINCVSLKSIDIPGNVINIGNCAFSNCNQLTNLNLSQGLKNIGDNAFNGCRSLVNLTIPASVSTIGNNAFINCSSLKNINIANGLNTIGNSAFLGCTGLESLNIPSSVTSIGNAAFLGCSNIKNINISEGVISIGNGAFQACTSLTSINIPKSIQTIPYHAFFYCTGLKSINISSGVTTIGEGAFESCGHVTSVSIPNSVTRIETSAFNNCTDLPSITIPSSVTSIGNNAFTYCGNLKDIMFPGTQAQWNAITKATDWRSHTTNSCIVHCTDGDISI